MAAVGRGGTRAGHRLAAVVLPSFPTAPAAAATPPPPASPFARLVVPRSAGLAVDRVAVPAARGLVAGRLGRARSTWRRGTRRFRGLSRRCHSLTAGRPRGEREFVVFTVAIGFTAGLTVAAAAVPGGRLDAGLRLTGRRRRFGRGFEAE